MRSRSSGQGTILMVIVAATVVGTISITAWMGSQHAKRSAYFHTTAKIADHANQSAIGILANLLQNSLITQQPQWDGTVPFVSTVGGTLGAGSPMPMGWSFTPNAGLPSSPPQFAAAGCNPWTETAIDLSLLYGQGSLPALGGCTSTVTSQLAFLSVTNQYPTASNPTAIYMLEVGSVTAVAPASGGSSVKGAPEGFRLHANIALPTPQPWCKLTANPTSVIVENGDSTTLTLMTWQSVAPTSASAPYTNYWTWPDGSRTTTPDPQRGTSTTVPVTIVGNNVYTVVVQGYPGANPPTYSCSATVVGSPPPTPTPPPPVPPTCQLVADTTTVGVDDGTWDCYPFPGRSCPATGQGQPANLSITASNATSTVIAGVGFGFLASFDGGGGTVSTGYGPSGAASYAYQGTASGPGGSADCGTVTISTTCSGLTTWLEGLFPVAYVSFGQFTTDNNPPFCTWHWGGQERGTTPGCFSAATRLFTADGRWIPADEIRTGELLWNPVTRQPVAVRRVIAGPEKLPLVEFRYDAWTLRVTTKHPMLTQSGILPAEAVTADDSLRGKDGELHRVARVRRIPSAGEPIVYNFELDAPDDDPDAHMLLAEGMVTGDYFLQAELETRP